MLKCTVHLIGSNLLAAGLSPHVQKPTVTPWWKVSLCWVRSPLLKSFVSTFVAPPLWTANGFVQGWKCSRQLQAFDKCLGYPSMPTAWVCVGVTARHSPMKPSAKLSHGQAGTAPLLGCLLCCLLSSPNVLVPAPHWLLTHTLPTLLYSVCLAVHVDAHQKPLAPSLPKFLTRHQEASKSRLFKKHQLDYNKKTSTDAFQKLSLFECWQFIRSAGFLTQALMTLSVRQLPPITSIFSFISSTSTFGARCYSVIQNTVQNYTSRHMLNTSHFSVLICVCFVHSKRNKNKKNLFTFHLQV